MKKIVKLVILMLAVFITTNVNAANYELKELIPKDVKTSITTNNFNYRNFKFTTTGGAQIQFEAIKNISDEAKPLSISIALFDSKRKSIGTINVCTKEETYMNPKEERTYSINIKSSNLSEGVTTEDIHYISVLNDNITCKVEQLDFTGQKIDEIGKTASGELRQQEKLAIQVISILAGTLFILFLYQLLFTTKYVNVDGDDVRQAFRRINMELRQQRDSMTVAELVRDMNNISSQPGVGMVNPKNTKSSIDQLKEFYNQNTD